MKKVDKISVFQLNPEQIEEIEKYIQKLVTLINKQFVEKSDDWLQYNYAFDLDISVIDQLVKLFHESRLFYKHSVDIANQYDNISKDLSLYNDPEIFRVVYPVLFFTLIMKNEVNKETIDSRLDRGTKSWGHKQNVFQIPPWEEEHIDAPDGFASLQKNLAQRKNELKKNRHRSLSQQKLLELSERAEILLDYEKIIRTQTSARIGLFVGSILKYIYQTEKNNKTNTTANIDTLIRLFLINEYDGIVSDSGILSNSVFSLIPEEKLLTEYYTKGSVIPNPIVDEDAWENFSRQNDLIQLGKFPTNNQCTINLIDSDNPKELYSCLSQLPVFTDDDIDDILEYFFSEKLLLWYAEYYNNIKDHVLKILRARDDVGLIVDDYELEELYSLINAEYTWNLLWLEKQKQVLKANGK